ncbi:hypothetical protein V6N13_024656 [Hibiscus sabdariffa]
MIKVKEVGGLGGRLMLVSMVMSFKNDDGGLATGDKNIAGNGNAAYLNPMGTCVLAYRPRAQLMCGFRLGFWIKVLGI